MQKTINFNNNLYRHCIICSLFYVPHHQINKSISYLWLSTISLIQQKPKLTIICIKVINCLQIMPSSNKSIHSTSISKSTLSIFFNLQCLILSISIYANTSSTSHNLIITSIPSSNLTKPLPSTYKIFFLIYQVLPTTSYLSIKSTLSSTLLSF